MGTFNTKKTLYGPASVIPEIASAIRDDFSKDGYEVSMDALSSGGYDISITKGGIFKAVLGMKTALKVTILPQDGRIRFEAGVGIFGQQAIPTV
ncbi:MAG: zinc ribbon domain-containing protein, partial [Candidatus Cryptobacteroides sp.]